MVVLLTDEAKSDLADIPPKRCGRIIKKMSYLADFPLMGFQMEDVYKGFRCLLADQGRCRIIYKVRGQEVIIYYIRHSSRQLVHRLVR